LKECSVSIVTNTKTDKRSSLRIDTLEALIMTKYNLADQTKGLKESIIDQYPMILDPNLLKDRFKDDNNVTEEAREPDSEGSQSGNDMRDRESDWESEDDIACNNE